MSRSNKIEIRSNKTDSRLISFSYACNERIEMK